LPGGRRGGAKKAQTVYLLGPENKLTPVEVRTGISDGRFTQIISGALKETDSVVVGVATSKVEGPPPMGGQGGPGGGGGRGNRRP
jgi:multidrug efflux pump subunit AcrA (membrane-fusion protein)